jgi:hypothetical protein
MTMRRVLLSVVGVAACGLLAVAAGAIGALGLSAIGAGDRAVDRPPAGNGSC